MKKLVTLFSVLMIFGTLSMASSKHAISITPSEFAFMKDGSVVRILYKAEHHNKVKISIENEKGTVVFSEYIQTKDGFVRPYNLSGLPTGTYTLKLSGKAGSYSEVFSIEAKKEIVYNVLQLKDEPSKYVLTIPSAKTGKVKVSVYDGGKLIHTEDVNVEKDFAKLFNFKYPDREIYFDVKSIH